MDVEKDMDSGLHDREENPYWLPNFPLASI